MTYIHPEFRANYAALPVYPLDDLAATRAQLAATRSGPRNRPPGLTVEDLTVPGDPAVPVRVYRPVGFTRPPALMYLHGGAFCMGDLDTGDALSVDLATGGGCVVVNVGYRLAPEYPFPAGLEDSATVLRWLTGPGADVLGTDGVRVAVIGQSAGGTLAASLAVLARDEQLPLALHILAYPTTDNHLDARSFSAVPDPRIFTRDVLEQAWKLYLSGSSPTPLDRYAVPSRVDNLAGVASACLVVGGLDPLRDQVLDYARQLLDADVSTDLRLVAGVPHGFDNLPSASVGAAARQIYIEALRATFASEE